MTIQDRIKKILNSWNYHGEDELEYFSISIEDLDCAIEEIVQTIAKKYSKHVREVFKWIGDDLTEENLNKVYLKRYQEYLLSAFKDKEAK